MSAPVLSWSFHAKWRVPFVKRIQPPPPKTSQGRPPVRAARKGRAVQRIQLRQEPMRRPTTPDPQSQSFSRGYGSSLPTSLIYIVLSTRGYTPWRPDAVMSTTRGANKSLPSGFQGASRACQTALRLSRFSSINELTPFAGRSDSRGQPHLSTRTDNSCWSPRHRPRLGLCHHSVSTSWSGNINPVPFR